MSGPGDHVALARPDVPRARHRDRGDLARRRDARRASRCRCGWARSRSSSHQTRRAHRRTRSADRRGRRSRARAVPRRSSRAIRRRRGSTSSRGAGRRGLGTARPTTPTRSAILQFTSGSTDDPKGVMLPHRCVVNNIDAIVEGAGLGAERPRRVVAAAVPRHGSHRDADDPDDDRLRPRARAARRTSSPRRPTGCAGCRTSAGRVTGGPNFAYALAAARCAALDDLDLSRVARGAQRRGADRPGCGRGVPRRPVRGHGLDSSAAFCVYGMAEATLAISFPVPGTGMTVDTVDRVVLETERFAAPATAAGTDARRLALLGRTAARPRAAGRAIPTPGTPLRDREVGELELRGTSVTPGYYQRDDADRRDLPRRLAAHRRPRLPRRRRARGLRPHQGRHHRRRSQRVPRGDRARRRGGRRCAGRAT